MVLSRRFYIEKARRELGESDETKIEQLKVFREWIENHKFFKKVRKGGMRNEIEIIFVSSCVANWRLIVMFFFHDDVDHSRRRLSDTIFENQKVQPSKCL